MVVAVPAFRVVPGFDPVEDRRSELVAAGPVVLVEEFSLQDREERLGNGIVVAITDGPHRSKQASIS